MKLLLASSALAIAFAVAPAYAQVTTAQPPETDQPADAAQSPAQPNPESAAPESTAPAASADGELTVQGVEPSRVLGAVDTEELVEDAAEAKAETSATAEAQPPENAAEETETAETEEADPEASATATAEAEGRATVDSAAVDTEAAAVGTQTATLSPDAPIAEEVQAVVEKGDYTTEDIVLAQLEAIRNAPVIEPTTTTTTTTTPAPG